MPPKSKKKPNSSHIQFPTLLRNSEFFQENWAKQLQQLRAYQKYKQSQTQKQPLTRCSTCPQVSNLLKQALLNPCSITCNSRNVVQKALEVLQQYQKQQQLITKLSTKKISIV